MNHHLDNRGFIDMIAILEDDPTTSDVFQQALELSHLASRAFYNPDECIKACLESQSINMLLTDLSLGFPN
jgi:DNA-binding NtrC family response regulator